MASLKDAQRLTEDLRSRAEELHNQVMDGDVELPALVRLADELGGAADRVAATFDKVNDALEQAEEGEEGEEGKAEDGEEREPAPRPELAEALAPASRDQEIAEPAGVPTSREELYERAEKVDIEIPGEPEVSDDEPA
jgi:hypothetical protein